MLQQDMVITNDSNTRSRVQKKEKTEQSNYYLHHPRSVTSIVLGKFFAAVAIILITILFSIIYAIIISFFGGCSYTNVNCNHDRIFIISNGSCFNRYASI